MATATSTQGLTIRNRIPKELQKSTASPTIQGENLSHPLESQVWQDRLRKLQQWRRQARVAQAENRTQMAIDEDYYDGIQLEAEDLSILMERKQPPLVFNVIKNTINWILGTEKKSRIDYRVLPRKKKGAQSAKSKTKLIKYIQDGSKGEFERSFAFEECIKAGLGWMEIAARSNNGEVPIFMKAERWRNMWFDHLGLSLDGSDWRYVIREKWVDLDIAQGLFPDRADDLRVLAEGINSLYPYIPEDIVATDNASEFDLESEIDAVLGGSFGGQRQRVKLVEGWYRLPDKVQILNMRDEDTPYGALDGTIFRSNNPDHQYLVRGQYFSLNDAYLMTVRSAIWAGSIYLQDILTPYNHLKFPFVPMFCYRRKRDNMPYGVIRDLRDPQSDLNRRKSRSLVLLTANRMIYEKGAFDDPIKAYDEFNRADTMLEVNKGILEGKIKILDNSTLIREHVEMARDDERFINNISGIQPEQKGESQRNLSGVAISQLQSQGQTTSGILFDSLYYAFQNAGEILLALEEQFFDQEQEIRITGDRQKDEFIKINEQTEKGIKNNILESKADFIIGKQDFRETIRIAMFQMLSDLVGNLSKTMPEVALALLDQVIDYMDDLPNKDEMVARIRKINKQRAPEEEMTPEEQQAFKQADMQGQQEQQVLKQLQMAMAQVGLAVKQAEVAGKKSQAVKNLVDAEMKKLEGFLKALEVAANIQGRPDLVGAADQLIIESQEGGQPQRRLGTNSQVGGQ